MKTIIDCHVDIWECIRQDLIGKKREAQPHQLSDINEKIHAVDEVIINMQSYQHICAMQRKANEQRTA